MTTTKGVEKVSDTPHLKYWEITEATDKKELTPLNAEKLLKLHYESASKTMKLDFYVWKDKKEGKYHLKYHEVDYSKNSADKITYTQSIPPENVKTVHTLDVKSPAKFLEDLKKALDSYYRGARPKTGEDKELSEIIYTKLGF
ncbi:MAG: hypothetical protein LBO09_00030 [Candidatus Peribacteria bacterium]|jgi:hypothetical protein|nr:hypothetical protein [Candidatus Peribacteria bacterium]